MLQHLASAQGSKLLALACGLLNSHIWLLHSLSIVNQSSWDGVRKTGLVTAVQPHSRSRLKVFPISTVVLKPVTGREVPVTNLILSLSVDNENRNLARGPLDRPFRVLQCG